MTLPRKAIEAGARALDNDVYYLESILRQLSEYKDFIGSCETLTPSIGGEVLADNIDWLDCHIEQLKRIASGELVPASAVAEEEERGDEAVRRATDLSRELAKAKSETASAVAAERERCRNAVRKAVLDLSSTDRAVGDICDHAIITAIRSLSPEPASGEFVVVPAKPIGWFNPWNDYHGFQQVAEEFEGGPDTIPLYADQKTHDDLKTAMLNAATKDGERGC